MTGTNDVVLNRESNHRYISSGGLLEIIEHTANFPGKSWVNMSYWNSRKLTQSRAR